MDAFDGTIAVFGLFLSGFSLRLALNANASLLQVSSISNFRANFRRFILSGSSKSRTEWLVGCCNDDVDGNTSSHVGVCVGGGAVTVADNWVLMPLDDALAFTKGSSYASICDLLLPPPPPPPPPIITNRFGDDSVELVLDDVNLQFLRE